MTRERPRRFRIFGRPASYRFSENLGMPWRAEVVSRGVGRQVDHGDTKNVGEKEVGKSNLVRQYDDARTDCKRFKFPTEIVFRSTIGDLSDPIR